MTKKQKGSLTVEASIALTAFMLLVVFILGFGRFNRAQSLVSHATMQASQSMAVDAYFGATIGDLKTTQSLQKLEMFFNFITNGESDVFTAVADSSDKTVDKARRHFVRAIADTEEEANEILLSLGVKDGLNGIDFSKSKIDGKDIIVHVEYTIEIQFAFTDDAEIEMSKSAKSKAFK